MKNYPSLLVFLLKLLLLAPLISCAAEDFTPCEIDLSPPEKNVCGGSFRLGVEWTALETAHIVLSVGRVNAFLDVPAFRIEEGGVCEIVQAPLPERILGVYERKERAIKIDSEAVNPEDLQVVMMHELLHSIGFRHRGAGVMCSILDGQYDFSPIDQIQCKELGYCQQ